MSSTVVHPNVPSMFSTPVLGSQLYILDGTDAALEKSYFRAGDNGSICGEIALVSPCLGLSTHLLNRDHFTTYYDGMSTGPRGEVLRRHGDEIEVVRSDAHLRRRRAGAQGESEVVPFAPNTTTLPYLRALGRCDDTMNIGGIKVGSVEIERVCNLAPGVKETAAIAISGPKGGPSKLVIYAVLSVEGGEDATAGEGGSVDTAAIRTTMQKLIKSRLNPLFGISDVVTTTALPRTASNKVMRRVLRDGYKAK